MLASLHLDRAALECLSEWGMINRDLGQCQSTGEERTVARSRLLAEGVLAGDRSSRWAMALEVATAPVSQGTITRLIEGRTTRIGFYLGNSIAVLWQPAGAGVAISCPIHVDSFIGHVYRWLDGSRLQADLQSVALPRAVFPALALAWKDVGMPLSSIHRPDLVEALIEWGLLKQHGDRAVPVVAWEPWLQLLAAPYHLRIDRSESVALEFAGAPGNVALVVANPGCEEVALVKLSSEMLTHTLATFFRF